MIQVILIASLLFGQYEVNWDGYDYYKPITDNFLFRPLGWTKPDSSPKYELLATVIGKDKKYFKAYIRNARNGRDYFVSVGDNIGDNVVQKINRGLVQLDGEEITGDTFGFINTSVRKRTETRQRQGNGASTSSGTGTKSTESQDSQVSTGVRQRTSRGRVGGSRSGGVDWQSQVQNFQNASPEERQNMIQQFRSMRGRGRGRTR